MVRPALGPEVVLELQRLRRPDQETLDLLAACEREAFGETGLRSYDLNVVAHAGALYVVLVGGSRGEVAACCQLIRSVDEADIMWVLGFWVRPAWQGRGLGRWLLEAVMAELPGAGARGLVLTADPANERALNLYTSVGFRRVEEIRDFYGPGEDRFLMRYQA